MAEVGQAQIATLVLDRYGDDTEAALAVYSPPDAAARDRRRIDVPTRTQDRRTWTGITEPYDTGGLWYHVWTVTGYGYGRVVNEIAVVADALEAPGFCYATTADLAAWLRDAPPADAERMLQAATREVDDLLTTAVYPVDGDGYPALAGQRDAVRDATCALAEWWGETGDESGAGQLYGSMSAGSISIGRTGTNGSSRSQPSRIPGRVYRILAAEGLYCQSPFTVG
jgi:hypothetical protein